MAKTLVERVQMTKDGLSENLIDQILNDDDLLILTNDLQDDVNIAATIGVLPTKFAMKGDQSMQLNGNVLAEEPTQATLIYDINAARDHLGNKEKDDTEEVIKFEKPQLERHLKPHYIKAYIDGRPIS